MIDDHEMVRIGVSAFLSVQPDIEVIGEAEEGAKGVELALANSSRYNFDGPSNGGYGWD